MLDMPQVREIEQRFKEKWKPEGSLGPGKSWMVVEKNGKVVGVASIVLVPEIQLLVDPSYGTPRERWEVARELVTVEIAEARKRGAEVIFAPVLPVLRGFARRVAKEFQGSVDNRIRLFRRLS